MPRIYVTVTDEFMKVIERYQKREGLKSQAASLMGLAELGSLYAFGPNDTPEPVKKWGGDRKPKKTVAASTYKRENVIKCIAKGIELDVQRGEYRSIIPKDGYPLYVKPGSKIVQVRPVGEDLEIFNGYEWVQVDEDCLRNLATIENVSLPPKQAK